MESGIVQAVSLAGNERDRLWRGRDGRCSTLSAEAGRLDATAAF